MSTTPLVTVGVPVYQGEAFLAETLDSIRKQTYQELEVLISLDGANEACETICKPFLEDSRFRLAVQPERLGWAGNISWLMAEARGNYWYYHQQDDLVREDYVEVLLAHAEKHPEAAVSYCDMASFGDREGAIVAAPVTGSTPFLRELAMLEARYHAVAFRGLTRITAVREAGPIPNNRFDNFACETAWLAAMALSGELQRVPLSLYRKRYHEQNTHLIWSTWGKDRTCGAWSAHCVNMLEQAMRAQDATPQQRRLLWLAAVERLLSPKATSGYLPSETLTASDRATMFEAFVAGARASAMHDMPALLNASDWAELEQWTWQFYQLSAGFASPFEPAAPAVLPSQDAPAARAALRAEYKATWDALSTSESQAMLSVASTSDEHFFAAKARRDVNRVKAVVAIRPTDIVLEIGCGVGRIGRVLAPECEKWIGTDVSGNMINFARQRLAANPNVELFETSGFSLEPISDGSVDMVYCTVVFMHLDEWERYGYVVESRRVLRPGGVLYVDNYNLASDQGWCYFEQHRGIVPTERPAHMSKSSTPEELRIYLERAGFTDIRVVEAEGWVVATGVSPGPLLRQTEKDASRSAIYDTELLEPATTLSFDEERYMAANPDVRAAVSAGLFPNARVHFDLHGLSEKRLQLRLF